MSRIDAALFPAFQASGGKCNALQYRSPIWGFLLGADFVPFAGLFCSTSLVALTKRCKNQ
jgi:hypothetical protein